MPGLAAFPPLAGDAMTNADRIGAAANDYAQVLNGGAKPPIGVPPFALPAPHTGGADVPTSPRAVGSGGLAGFVSRFFNPQNPLGQFGMALAASGNNDLSRAMAMMMQTNAENRRSAEQAQAAEATRKAERDDWQWRYDYEADHPKPDVFTANDDRVRYDPATGESTVLYHAPSDAENYAVALGLDPATDEGRRAIQDFVLRSSGPSALAGGERLENLRFRHRSDLRATPTWGQAHPRVPGALAPARRRPTAAPSVGDAPTATGPGGKRLILRDGKWVPIN